MDTEKEVQELRQRVEQLEAAGSRKGQNGAMRFIIGFIIAVAIMMLLLVAIGIVQFISA
ncbi:hypothetical protein [Paenibacillus herberti]|uniref:hypothetical protein n=1 Tax=Paenibacillus herberti TaxID=1619309 RepID=UPI001595F871|nr:hypothetical protein [Paenibacillus herberti]